MTWNSIFMHQSIQEFVYRTAKIIIIIESPHDKTNKIACAPSEDTYQPGHPLSLIKVFSVRSVGSWGPNVSLCWQRRLWSDWADAQADLREAHMSFCWFCHAVAQFIIRSFSIARFWKVCILTWWTFCLQKKCWTGPLLGRRRSAYVRNFSCS